MQKDGGDVGSRAGMRGHEGVVFEDGCAFDLGKLLSKGIHFPLQGDFVVRYADSGVPGIGDLTVMAATKIREPYNTGVVDRGVGR